MPEPHSFLLEEAGLARLSHISLEVADLDRALDFYREIFGMQIVLDLTLDGPDFEAVTATPGARSRMLRDVDRRMRLLWLGHLVALSLRRT